MYIPSNSDRDIPVKRLQLNVVTNKMEFTPKKELFLRGPIPLEWLVNAAALPGKTLNVAIALWWLYGMAKVQPFKLTRRSLKYLSVERDAAGMALTRLEEAGLLRLERKPGQRPVIAIVLAAVIS